MYKPSVFNETFVRFSTQKKKKKRQNFLKSIKPKKTCGNVESKLWAFAFIGFWSIQYLMKTDLLRLQVYMQYVRLQLVSLIQHVSILLSLHVCFLIFPNTQHSC